MEYGLLLMEKRRKILFITNEYITEEGPLNGIYIREQAKAVSLYDEVVVLFVYPEASRSTQLYHAGQSFEDGIRTIRVPYHRISQFLQREFVGHKPADKFSVAIHKLLSFPLGIIDELLYYDSIFASCHKILKKGWKPDIIHVHIYRCGVPAIIFGRLYGIPVVITEHLSVFLLRKLGVFSRMKARLAMGRCAFILPVSEALKRSIEAYGVHNRYRVVPNVVDSSLFHHTPSKGRTEEPGKKRLLMVAALFSAKGVPILLQALSQLKQMRQDFALDIVGDGPDRAEYEELARQLGLDREVKFHGLKTKSEVAEFMKACDFLVQPSLWETFGIVSVEAIACGKPVIATNIGATREIINQEVGILVPPGNVTALVKAIAHMLDNHGSYSPEKLAQYAHKRFSYQTVGQTLHKIYEETAIMAQGKRNQQAV